MNHSVEFKFTVEIKAHTVREHTDGTAALK